MEREKRQRDYFLGKARTKTDDLYRGKQGSQTQGSRGLRYVLVPKIAQWITKRAEKVHESRAGIAVSEFLRLKSWMDAETMAHITLSVILDKLGRGSSLGATIADTQIQISQQVEHQAFIEYMAQTDPGYFQKLQRWYLNDPIRTYKKKMKALIHAHNRHEEMDWQWMDLAEHAKFGSLLLQAVMSIRVDAETGEGLFVAKPPRTDDENRKKKRSKEHKDAFYLGFSVAGLKYRDMLQAMADEDSMKATPMVCEPLDWSLEQRGGYLSNINRKAGDLIHHNNGSIPSQIVIDSLNRLQKVPFRINTYILNLQEELHRKTWEIGSSFRTYEKDSWEDEHFPLVDSAWLASLSTDSQEYQDTMQKLTAAYHNQKIDEKKSETTRRTFLQAKELAKEERIYFAWFLDQRGRLYPLNSGLSPQGSDSSKALLMSADGAAVNEDTKRDLLISIATAGAFDGVDKKDFFERYNWAAKYVQSGDFERMVLQPLDHKEWMEADEPFCFLALCHEYYRIYITQEQDRAYVFFGRDATCSGVQILSAIIQDEKAARFTNVLVTEEPQDLYGEVAIEAKRLMQDEHWLRHQMELRETKRLKHNAKCKPENQWEERWVVDVDPEVHDRSVNKTQAMTCGYGATLRTRYNNIKDALRKKIKKGQIEPIHVADQNIVCAAGIQGMSNAFPAYMELNKWFKRFAKAALQAGCEQITWTTPSGMYVSQEYREPLFKQVQTYAAGGGHYGTLGTSGDGSTYIEHGFGDPKLSKNQSAIAANWTHSLDASVMQLGLTDVDEEIDLYTVHDCIYCLSGQFGEVIPHFRKALHNVVTSPVLEDLLESNNLENLVDLPPIGEIDLDQIKESPYLFC
jgi:DNA-directed RNA polymerase